MAKRNFNVYPNLVADICKRNGQDVVIAQKVLKELLNRAKTNSIGCTIYCYGELNMALGVSKYARSNFQLTSVRDVILELGKLENEKIPVLNSMCKKTGTKLPSTGFHIIEKTYNSMNRQQQRVITQQYDQAIINYGKTQGWDWVIQSLDLK